jgi:adenosylmethionine-8-amino-7-oxononanoate aminotransferase
MTLSQKDVLYNWHPYTQHQDLGLLPAIVKAKGVYFYDENNKPYLDAISSWWTCVYGHSHPAIIQAVKNQLDTLDHVLFGGFTHQAAVELSQKLIEILPHYQKVFYSDNGSTSVEVALKACLQYFINQNIKKTKIIAFEDAFHGDTFGAMAVSGINVFHDAFKDILIEVERIPIPTYINEKEVISTFKNLVNTNEYACFIFEPLVQGAAGMKMYNAHSLDIMIEICKNNDVFTIADEVMTGFGKTSKPFAINHLINQPDVICLSKALTAGTLPMAVTLFTKEIFNGFLSNNVNQSFMHGHTFTANPMGCAVAKASIVLFQTQEIQNNLVNINQKHLEFKEKIKNHPRVEKVEVLGVILSITIKTEEDNTYYGTFRNKLYQFFITKGILIRPIGNVIYTIPPFIISNAELEIIYNAFEECLNSVY